MSWLQHIRSKLNRFEPKTIIVPPLGEATSDRYGFWNFKDPVMLNDSSVGIAFKSGPQPPSDPEIAFFKKVELRWSKLWTLVLEALSEDFKDDTDPDGKKLEFFREVKPNRIVFFDLLGAMKQWEITVQPEIYEGHIVTIYMENLTCAGVRLDG